MNSDRTTQRIYRGVWGVLARYFRVPQHPPEVPGRADAARPFKPSPDFLRYLRLWFWIMLLIIDLGLLACWIVIFVVDWVLGLALMPIAVAVIVLPDIIAWLAIHLRYDTTWYVMTDRALRIRRGIWIIDERTITYENIQNVKVTQGPIQRAFNIANVIVETAGAGSVAGKQQASVGNRGVLEGIRDASAIRDRILVKMRASGAAGLGDEIEKTADCRHDGPRWPPAHLELLRQIRDELAAIS